MEQIVVVLGPSLKTGSSRTPFLYGLRLLWRLTRALQYTLVTEVTDVGLGTWSTVRPRTPSSLRQGRDRGTVFNHDYSISSLRTETPYSVDPTTMASRFFYSVGSVDAKWVPDRGLTLDPSRRTLPTLDDLYSRPESTFETPTPPGLSSHILIEIKVRDPSVRRGTEPKVPDSDVEYVNTLNPPVPVSRHRVPHPSSKTN